MMSIDRRTTVSRALRTVSPRQAEASGVVRSYRKRSEPTDWH